MKQTTKKQIAMLLVCCMLFTLLPTTALADTAPTQSSTSIFAGGEGTSTSAYEIATLEQLEAFRDSVNAGNDYAGKYIKLTADIDLSSKYNATTGKSWTPIGGGSSEYINIYKSFNGNFDGAGHSISGLYIHIEEDKIIRAGFFGVVDKNGTIQNLGVAGTITVINKRSNGTNYIGGVVGINKGIVQNCYNTCHNTGTVTGTRSAGNYIGGVVGHNSGIVQNCYNTGDVTGIGVDCNDVGGVVGFNNDTVQNCYNIGEVKGTGGSLNRVGGVVGRMWIDKVQDCYYLSGTAAKGIGEGDGSANSLDEDAFKLQASFISWDFTDIWEMSDYWERPILRNNIEKAMLSYTAPTAKTALEYDGAEQELITKGNVTTGGTLLYSLKDEENSYSKKIPTGKDATTYSVYYYVNGGKYYHSTTPQSIEVTIAPKNITNAQITIGDSFTYNGQEQTLNDITVTVAGIDEALEKDKDYTITDGNSGTNANTYTLTIEGKGNFTGSASQTWSIAKATATVTTAPTAKTDLVENGEPQELIKAGSANGGTLMYSLDGTNYFADIPKGTEAKDYIVWYKVVSDNNNYSDSEPKNINVTIAQKQDNNNSSNNNYSGGGGYYAPEQEKDKTEETIWSNPFTDVHESDWYYHAVKYAHQHKLFAGMSATEFAPNMPMSRGMLVTVLYRMAGSLAVTGDMPFGDVNSDAYYRNAILWAVQNNIVSGIADDLFAPAANITREQIAIILYRFAQYCGYDTSVGEDTNILSYDDFTDINEYAITAMQYAAGSGFLNGRTESTLNPQDTATRAEVAAILQRFIENNQ